MTRWVSKSKAERLADIRRVSEELFHYMAKAAWWRENDDIRRMSDQLGELQRMVEQLYHSETRCKSGHTIVPGRTTCQCCGAREVETT